MRYIVVAIVAAVIVDIIVGIKFDSIAQEKGHEGYLGWCIIFGICGWMMVIALPDIKNAQKANEGLTAAIDRLSKAQSSQSQKTEAEVYEDALPPI